MEIARVILLACLMLASVGAATGAERGFYFGAVGGQTNYDFESPLNRKRSIFRVLLIPGKVC